MNKRKLMMMMMTTTTTTMMTMMTMMMMKCKAVLFFCLHLAWRLNFRAVQFSTTSV